MANSVLTIKIQIEGIDKLAKAAASGGTRGGGGAASGGIDPSVSDDLRKAFSELASSVRAMTASLEQAGAGLKGAAKEISNAPKVASGGTSAGSVNADQEAAKASAAKEAATKQATVADEAAADALKDKAAAAVKEAEASGEIASVLDDLRRKWEGTTKAAAGAADTTDEIRKSLTKLSSLSSGKINPAAAISDVIRPISKDRTLNDAAQKLRGNLEGFFTVPQGASDKVKREADKARILIEGAIRQVVEGLSSANLGTSSRGLISGLRSRIDEIVKETALAGIKPIEVNMKSLVDSLHAQELVSAINIVEKAFQRGQALKEAGQDFSSAMTDIEASVSNFNRVAGKVAARKNTGAIGAGANELISQTIGLAASPLDLTPFQRQIVETTRAQAGLKQPLELARSLFNALVKDMENFESNLRQVNEGLRETALGDVGNDQESKKKIQELLGLTALRRDAAGRIRGATAAAGDASASINTQKISDFRASLAGAGRGTTITEGLSFTDATGNIRKMVVELKQMGATADSVRVKVRELSNNMFDRTSVKTALQRVAVWGSAAGLVFGAINAFRQGVDTVVKTESSIVTLGKVMDEAQKDFEGFKKEATESAITISQDFGQPIKDVIDTMILFAQQGKNMKDTLALTRASALASQVTTLDQPQAASALTAVTEQFGIQASDAISIVDKLNNVANNAAVTETALAEAVRRAGNAAANAGVDFDQFNGIVAAISEQTRQAGSEIGNALRFIFARINTDEAEKGLSKVGVAVRDAGGNVKPFVSIVEELAGKFDTLSDSQKNQVAISVAGGHRFNSFLALVQNFDRFQQSATDSTNSAGSAMKEQARVAETAAFKIQQLKNSVSATALSFGNVFLPALKGITDVAGGLFDALSKIPDPLKLIGVAAAAAGIAFARFSDHAVAFIDLFDRQGGGIFGALSFPFRGSTTQGRDIGQQQARNPAQFQEFQSTAPGRNAARTVGDFASTAGFSTLFKGGGAAAEEFSKALEKGNLELLDQNNQVIKNTQGITKFTAVTRGYSTQITDANGNIQKSTLGLHALNSVFGKIIGTIVIFSRQITNISGLGIVIRAGERGVSALARSFGVAEGNAKSLAFALGSIARVAGAFALLTVGLDLLGKLKDAVTRTGDSTKAELSEEIAKRQEAANKIAEQRKQMDSLSKAQLKSASVSAQAATEPSVLRDERIRQGQFKDPLLERQRLAAAQQRASNQIGFANPQLIDHVDEFGNAVLRSADAFDQLSSSASSAQERILAALQTDVIEGFIGDLDPASGLKKFGGKLARGFGDVIDAVPNLFGKEGLNLFEDTGKTARDKFEEELSGLEDLLKNPKLKSAQKLGIDISLLDEDFSKQLDKQALAVEKAGLDIRGTISKIRAEISKIPADSIEPLLKSGKFQDFSKLAARQLTADTGTPTTETQFRRQLLLQNRSAFKGIGGLIGTSGAETAGRLNERGILGKTLDLQKNLADQLKGGELAVIKGLVGFDQAEIVVNELGQVLLKSLNEQTGKIDVKPLTDDLIKQINDAGGNIQLFDPKLVRQNIERSLLEITRVISGGARGSLLGQDLDLGVGRRFQASSQQLASIRDEPLTRDVLAARKELENFKETFKTPLEGSDVEAALNTEALEKFKELSINQDVVDTAFRFAAGVEEVGRAFEEAIDKIESDRITDTFKTQFSGVLGAARGIVEDKTNVPLREDQLSPEQIFAKFAPTLIQSASRLSQSEVATGESLAAGANLERSIGLIVSELTNAASAGGVRDSARLSQLAAERFKKAEDQGKSALDLQIAVAEKSLSAQEEQVRLLQELVNRNKNSGDVAGGLAAANQLFASGGITAESLASAVSTLSEKQLGGVSRTILQTTQGNLGSLSPDRLLDALEKKTTEALSKTLTSNLLKLDTKEGAAPEGDSASARVLRIAANLAGREAESFTSKALEDFVKENRDAIKARPGGELGITEEQLRAFGRDLVDGLSKAGLGSQAAELSKNIESGNKAVFEEMRKTISAALVVPKGSRTEREKDPVRTIEEEGKKRIELIRAMNAAKEATHALIEPLILTAGGFKSLGFTIAGAITGIRDSIGAAIAKIENSRFLGALGSNVQAGLLKGTRDVGFDPGKTREQLAGRDLTLLGNQGLIQAGNDFQEVFTASRTALEDLKNKEREILAVRSAAVKKGDAQTVNAADQALKQVGGTFDFLRNQAESASGVISRLGDTINNLDAVNQLQVDIERLFTSFEKQKAGAFDTTSIDAALGRNLFSATRPTFEQFEQGQSGFLTKFERSIEDIRFQERTGQLGPQQAGTARRKAEFERDEELIALAQQRENKAFESEVQLAEGLKDRLLDFSFSGASAGGQARALADALKSELEQAGDLVPSSGSRSIRDPRTGRDVNVPASKLLEFRGVRGLGDIEGKVQQIAAQVKSEEQQKNASLINQPIVDTLKTTSELELQKLQEIITALNENPANKSAENIQKVVDALGGKSQSIQDLASGTLNGTQEIQAASDVAGALANLNVPAADLAAGFDTFKVSVDGMIISFAKFKETNDALIDQLAIGTAKISTFWDAWKAGVPPEGKASGGLITGPGGPRSDRVPVMASNGEFVMRASAVSKIGLPLLMAMNAGRYAGGGLIDEEDIDFEKEERRIREALQRKVRRQKRLRGERVAALEAAQNTELSSDDIRPFSRSAGAVSDSLLDEQQLGGTIDLTSRLRQLEAFSGEDAAQKGLNELADIKEKSHQKALESEKDIKELFFERATALDQQLRSDVFSGAETVRFANEAAYRSPEEKRLRFLVTRVRRIAKGEGVPESKSLLKSSLEGFEGEIGPLVAKLSAQGEISPGLKELLAEVSSSDGTYKGSALEAKARANLEARTGVKAQLLYAAKVGFKASTAAPRAVIGLGKALASPIESGKGIGHAFANPLDTLGAIGSSIANTYKSGDPEKIAELSSDIAFGVGSGVGGLKNLSKVGKLAGKASKLPAFVRNALKRNPAALEQVVEEAAKQGIKGKLAGGVKSLGKFGLKAGAGTGASAIAAALGASDAVTALAALAPFLGPKVLRLAKKSGALALGDKIFTGIGARTRGAFGRVPAPGAIKDLLKGGPKTELSPELLEAASKAVGLETSGVPISGAAARKAVGTLDPAFATNPADVARAIKNLEREALGLGPPQAASIGPLSGPARKASLLGPTRGTGTSLVSQGRAGTLAKLRLAAQLKFGRLGRRTPTTAGLSRGAGRFDPQAAFFEQPGLFPDQIKTEAANRAIFARRAQLDSEASGLARVLGSSRSKAASIAEARRLGLSPEDLPSLERFQSELQRRGRLTGAASGEITAKPFNKGRFQPSTSGRVIVDKKLQRELENTFGTPEFLAKSLDKTFGKGKYTIDSSGRLITTDRVREQFLENILPGDVVTRDFSGRLAKELSEVPSFENRFGARPLGPASKTSLRNLHTALAELRRRGIDNPTLQDILKVVEPFEAPGGLKRRPQPPAIVDAKKLKKELEDLLATKNLKGKFASGGSISGAGGPRSDRVPILASNGEFILNSETVRKIGAPMLNYINKTGAIPFGSLPRFAEGGLVSPAQGGGPSRVEVNVNTEAISAAIRSAIEDALTGASIPLNTEQAANDITSALSNALANIQLPELEVNTENVSVPLDVPPAGIPIDVRALTGLNLGDNLGAGVRNRLEAVEGTVSSLREDTNEILDTIEGVDFEALLVLPDEISEVKAQVEDIPENIELLQQNLAAQKIEILDKVFTMINEQISNSQDDSAIVARLDKHIATTDSAINNLSNNIAQAVSLATKALSQALARV